MATRKTGRKAPDLAPKALKSKTAESVRGGSTISGNQASVKTINWSDPPEPDLSQRSRLNKV